MRKNKNKSVDTECILLSDDAVFFNSIFILIVLEHKSLHIVTKDIQKSNSMRVCRHAVTLVSALTLREYCSIIYPFLQYIYIKVKLLWVYEQLKMKYAVKLCFRRKLDYTY